MRSLLDGTLIRLMSGEMVTLRATRAGYVPTEKTVCVPSPVGNGAFGVTLDLRPE